MPPRDKGRERNAIEQRLDRLMSGRHWKRHISRESRTISEKRDVRTPARRARTEGWD